MCKAEWGSKNARVAKGVHEQPPGHPGHVLDGSPLHAAGENVVAGCGDRL